MPDTVSSAPQARWTGTVALVSRAVEIHWRAMQSQDICSADEAISTWQCADCQILRRILGRTGSQGRLGLPLRFQERLRSHQLDS